MLLEYETSLLESNITLVAGVDEVGRGPLIGPVVAAAVILPNGYNLEGLTDSKKLSEKKRIEYFQKLHNDAIAIGIGFIDNKVIDEVNILNATKLAMKEAIKNLKVKPEHVLIDAVKLDIDIPSTSIIKGDQKSLSIAAASVIAKVTRDQWMIKLDEEFPEYGFKNHKGYGTKMHLENMNKYGLLDSYRFTFKPVHGLIFGGGMDETKIRKTNI